MMKKLLFIAVCAIIILSFGAVTVNASESTRVIYVADAGNDSNSGESVEKALKTLSAAFGKIDSETEIILINNTTFTNTQQYNGKLTIKGNDSNVTLTIPAEISLKGDLKFDNIVLSGTSVIYANGYTFETGSKVTSTARLTVYGGKKSSAYTGDTNIILFGGLYGNIYGGGNGGAVNGNTNVILGGNANAGDVINDSSDKISPCMVFGGGANGTVTGKTNVTLQDNAVTKYLVGAGTGSNGTAIDTNIYIKGGKVMNVYGGSRDVTLPSGTNTHITITGGLAEALFGGCEGVAMNGHTYINLLGGEVSRRVYTGCYNDTKTKYLVSLEFTSDRYVTGTTTLRISPNVKVNTKTGLSGTNALNVGLFSGSRTAKQHDAEQNTIIYLDNCYSTMKGKIGEKGGLYTSIFKSFEDYVVDAGVGGNVYGTKNPGVIYVEPEWGNCGAVNGAYYKDENVSISSGTTDVIFEKNFDILEVTATGNTKGVSANISFVAKNAGEEPNPRIIVAVYESGTKKFVGCGSFDASVSDSAKTLDIDSNMEAGKTYIVKVMLFNSNLKPLNSSEETTITVG